MPVAGGTFDTEHSPATNTATIIAKEGYGNHAKLEIGDKAIKNACSETKPALKQIGQQSGAAASERRSPLPKLQPSSRWEQQLSWVATTGGARTNRRAIRRQGHAKYCQAGTFAAENKARGLCEIKN